MQSRRNHPTRCAKQCSSTGSILKGVGGSVLASAEGGGGQDALSVALGIKAVATCSFEPVFAVSTNESRHEALERKGQSPAAGGSTQTPHSR
jgi:hypothetical protein